MRHRRERSPTLYRRFYGYTLLVVLASMALAFTIANAGGGRQFREHFYHVGASVGRVVADQIAPSLDDPQKLRPALSAVAARLNARLAVFDPQGKLLESSGAALPTPLPDAFTEAAQRGSLSGHQQGQGHWILVPIERNGAVAGYLQGALVHRIEPPNLLRAAGSFALVLALIALLMVPATRSVTRPLEELTASARRFGAGDFSHRIPVVGRDEIGGLARAMNEMAERLSAMLHTQRELLANVSHELRSPLARIEVALELARAQTEASGPLAEIEADVAELSRLIDDCLAASRLELRPESVRPSRVSLATLIGEARRRLLAAGLAPGRLTVQIPADLPEAWADGEACAHAVQNLLDNARKHTPEGTAITVGAERDGDRLRLFVHDAGPGLAEEELSRLFEPFYRPDASRNRDGGGGAGLGLSLVRRIAELHGAEPQVTSAAGQGTRFSFSVPLAPA